jgi:hypothetical protein
MTTASQINMKIGTTAEVFRGGIQMGDLGIIRFGGDEDDEKGDDE